MQPNRVSSGQRLSCDTILPTNSNHMHNICNWKRCFLYTLMHVLPCIVFAQMLRQHCSCPLTICLIYVLTNTWKCFAQAWWPGRRSIVYIQCKSLTIVVTPQLDRVRLWSQQCSENTLSVPTQLLHLFNSIRCQAATHRLHDDPQLSACCRDLFFFSTETLCRPTLKASTFSTGLQGLWIWVLCHTHRIACRWACKSDTWAVNATCIAG